MTVKNPLNLTAFELFPQLSQGTLVTVPPSLVKQCKNHFHNLLCGASLILGNNGYIWISTKVSDDHQQPQMRFQTPHLPLNKLPIKEEAIKIGERETIARLRNCVLALAQHRVLLFDTTVQYTYEASLKYQVHTRSFLSSQYMSHMTLCVYTCTCIHMCTTLNILLAYNNSYLHY